MKRLLLLLLLVPIFLQSNAQYPFTRNGSNNAYRNQYQRIAVGRNNTFVIRGGRLYVNGYGGQGELGLGNTQSNNILVPQGTDSDWISIATSSLDFNSLAIKADGTMWAWGENEFGHLGLGNTLTQYSPVQVGTDHDWVKVTTDEFFSIALKADGSLWACGGNDGELGIGVTGPPIYNFVPVDSAHDWVTIAMSPAARTWAIKADGTLWTWGENSDYGMGLGDSVIRLSPTQVGTSNRWVQTGIGEFNFIGVQCDGTIWSWGRNGLGELGLGDTFFRYTPQQMGIDHDWTWVTSLSNTMALKANGTLWGWGADQGNNYSAFGWGAMPVTTYSSPVQVSPSTDWVSNAGYYGRTFGLKADGSVNATGNNDDGQLCIGQWGGGTDTFQSVDSPARDWVSGSTGASHSLAVYSDGSLWAWGYNVYGQLGLGNIIQQDSMLRVGAGSTWVAAAAGGNYSLGMQSNGSLWAWGRNNEGQLGLGNNNDQHSPVQVSGTWTAMAAGDAHTLALKADGTLWAWGRNNEGQLGTGNNSNSNTPVQVGTDDTWIAIATGGRHSIAIKTDGTLWTWGDNSEGQLGLGNNTSHNTPQQVGNEHMWTLVSGGDAFSLAKKADGTLWSWGRNAEGQLGLGNNAPYNTPQQVPGAKWKGINAGKQHCLAWKADGTIYSWGANGHGQLGIGNNTNQNSPQPVNEPAIVHIFCGPEAEHTGIIKFTRRFLCMAGRNDHGQLGDSTITDKNTFSCINECVTPLVTISLPGTDTVCSGDTTVFTAMFQNGGPNPVFQWFRNNVPVGSNNDSLKLNPNSLATGDVIKCVLTANAACMVTPTDTSNVITMAVTPSVTPTITITPDIGDTICIEHIVTYTATITSGGPTPVYQWYENNVPVGSNSPTHQPALVNGNVVKCKLISSAVCPSPHEVTSAPHTIMIAPVVTPQVTISANPSTVITQNQSVTFTANVTNAANPQYQWKKNGVNIAGATQQTYTSNTLQMGDVISCRVRGYSICDTASAEVTMTVWAVAVNSVAGNGEQIYVYPNPVKDDLTLALSTGGEGNYTVSICDMAGRELITDQWYGKTEKHISMKGLASGTYMLRVEGEGVSVVKMVTRE